MAENGAYTVNDVVAVIRDDTGKETELTLCQRWPIRTPRPVKEPSADQPSADYRAENHRRDVPDC